MQPQGTGLPPVTHTPPGTRPISITYMQLSHITFAIYGMQIFCATSAAYTLLSSKKPTLAAAYTQPSGIKHIFLDHFQLLTILTYLVYHPPSTNNPLVKIITINIGHGRKLLNLAKIYIDKAKYSGRNNSFTFKFVIFHDICSKADILFKAKMKTFLTILKDLALDNYYSNISTSTFVINFD